MRKSLYLALAASLLSLTAVATAQADMAPSSTVTCEGADKAKCSTCDKPDYENADTTEFDACAATQTGKGLVQSACSVPYGSGGSRTYYFCPSGVTLTESTSADTGGCAVGGTPDGALLALLGVGLLAGAAARRRRG
jgi:MYXO-CTERM domain-containing protein